VDQDAAHHLEHKNTGTWFKTLTVNVSLIPPWMTNLDDLPPQKEASKLH